MEAAPQIDRKHLREVLLGIEPAYIPHAAAGCGLVVRGPSPAQTTIRARRPPREVDSGRKEARMGPDARGVEA